MPRAPRLILHFFCSILRSTISFLPRVILSSPAWCEEDEPRENKLLSLFIGTRAPLFLLPSILHYAIVGLDSTAFRESGASQLSFSQHPVQVWPPSLQGKKMYRTIGSRQRKHYIV